MALDYLKFVEAHENHKGFNVFEKVLMATHRAKAIYEEEKARAGEDSAEKKKVQKKSFHKPTYLAILEINEGKLALTYSEKTPALPVEPSPTSENPPPVAEPAPAE